GDNRKQKCLSGDTSSSLPRAIRKQRHKPKQNLCGFHPHSRIAQSSTSESTSCTGQKKVFYEIREAESVEVKPSEVFQTKREQREPEVAGRSEVAIHADQRGSPSACAKSAEGPGAKD